MTTPNIGLVELANSQGQYLNANETFAIIDALLGKVVIDKDLNTPPGSPSDGHTYIVGPSPTGLWAGQANKITFWSADAGEWVFITPREGWRFEPVDEDNLYRYSGTSWALTGFVGGTLTTALNEAPIVTIASASTVGIGAASANTINISGTTTITAFDSIASGAERTLVFQGSLTLTHNGTSLILPTSANITTAAGDVAVFTSLGSGNWRCTDYMRANGQALVTPGGGFTGGTLSSALNEAPAVSIASAATVNIGAAAANTVNITGTTTITAFDNIANGAVRRLIFDNVLTLTHNSTSLILPEGVSFTTKAGDVATFLSLGSGNWRCIGYMRSGGEWEYGSNANGEYWRFANGLQVAKFNFAVTSYAIGTAYLGGFRGAGQNWTYPASFSTAPEVNATSDNLSGFGCGKGISNTTITPIFWFAVTSQAAADRLASVTAIGKWR